MKGHTPGPWSIDETPVDYVAIRGPKDAPVWLKSVAEIDVLGGDVEQERVARANVRLIAQAPMMLEALAIFLDAFDRGLVSLPKTGLEIARSALAKVEGR